jgi:twinkle protein
MADQMIIKPSDCVKAFNDLRKGGLAQKALSTGFNDLDPYIKLAKGYMAVLGAIPGMGKSEFVDGLMINMTLLHNWKVLFFSPENYPIENHMQKLAEKFIGKHISRFTAQDSSTAIDYLQEYFTWMYPKKPTLDTLLTLAAQQKPDCLVLDPWNGISHQHTGMLHTDLGESLTKTSMFCREQDVFTLIVHHPTKPTADKNGVIPPLNLYSLSDGAMWRNKVDYGIIIERPDMSKHEIAVRIGKIKNKWMGSLGEAMLDYDWQTGRFKGKNDLEFTLPNEIQPAF